MARTWIILGLLPAIGFGCAKPGVVAPARPASHIGRDFDPTTAGTIMGRVVWTGDIPVVPKFQAVTTNHLSGIMVANPHAPRIDPADRGLAGVVVSL